MTKSRTQLTYRPSASDVRKHKNDWTSEKAGFRADADGYDVGKCPKHFDLKRAQELRNEGIPVRGRRKHSPYPQDVYNVFEGVPYRAHPSGRGGVYHGFPEFPDKIPPAQRAELRERAQRSGDLDAFDQWTREHAQADDA